MALQSSSMTGFIIGFDLGPWEDYLVQELTPDLGLEESLPEPRISWISQTRISVLPDFAENLIDQSGDGLSLTFDQSQSSLAASRATGVSNGNGNFSLRREIVTSGFSHQFSERSAFSVSAVLATQEYGSAMMDLQREDERYWYQDNGFRYGSPRNVTHGTGLKLGLTSQLMTGVSFNAAVQSRIDMEELSEFRGIYNRTADLDIPPRASAGLEVQASQRNFVNLSVDQVFYSDVTAFPSRAMPARFLSLLGDSSSPEFAWKDLTVYSLGWRLALDSDLEFQAVYSTRTQPTPSSSALARALGDELASNSFLVGLTKSFDPARRFEFTASYAPPEYAFGGNVMGVVTDQLDQSFEVQALMNWRY